MEKASQEKRGLERLITPADHADTKMKLRGHRLNRLDSHLHRHAGGLSISPGLIQERCATPAQNN